LLFEKKIPMDKKLRFAHFKLTGFLFLMFISTMVHAQYDVVLGTDNVPITKVGLTRNGVSSVQTVGNQATVHTTDEILLDSIVVNDGGTSKVLQYSDIGGAIIRNNNFSSSVTGVGVYNQGVETLASDSANWESEMRGVVSDRNLLHYLFYDGSTNIPTGSDFDIRWARGLTNNDYMVVSERDGNTFFTLTPLDSTGAVISGARELRFGFQSGTTSANGNDNYDWNISYASTGRFETQPQYMTVVDVSLFNTNSTIYGLRIDNTGDADVKFFAFSDSSLANNPINRSVPGLSGNIFLDTNGNQDNTVNGKLIDTAGGNQLYVSLIKAGTIISTVPVDAYGKYNFLNLESGVYSTVLHTTSTGSTTPSLPTNWVNTGENQGSGAGTDTLTNGKSPAITVVDSLETDVNFGIQRLPDTDAKVFVLSPSPIFNEIRDLIVADGMGSLAGFDAEDGIYGTGNTFVVQDTVGMNGNTLFYDLNNDGILDAGEVLSPSDTISNYNPNLLSVVFSGINTTDFSFTYLSIDAAGFGDPSPAGYAVSWANPLPVSWIHFDAQLINKNQVRITWSTAMELNCDKFIVERSSNAKDWQTLYTLSGSGNSITVRNYQFIDESPNQLNFYRVKQLDNNGSFEYTNTTLVRVSQTAILNIYPNPVRNRLTIQLNSLESEPISMTIVDELGKTYFETIINKPVKTINVSNLKTGIYFIRIGTAVFKFSKL